MRADAENGLMQFGRRAQQAHLHLLTGFHPLLASGDDHHAIRLAERGDHARAARKRGREDPASHLTRHHADIFIIASG